MENKVYNYIKKYNMINEGDRVLAGVSGGAELHVPSFGAFKACRQTWC